MKKHTLLKFSASFTACALFLAGCGGGSGGNDTSTPTTSTKTYKQQILGLVKGNYAMSCQDALSLNAASDAVLSITDSGEILLTGDTTVNISDAAAVFSISTSFIENSTSNPITPGVAVLGKSGNNSVGITFIPSSDANTYQISQFFLQNSVTSSIKSCTPKGVQKMATAWRSVALLSGLTNGSSRTGNCSDGNSAIITTSNNVLTIKTGINTATYDFSTAKIKELYQAPIDQINPLLVSEGNFNYSATFVNGDSVNISQFALTGIGTVSVTSGTTSNTLTCTR